MGAMSETNRRWAGTNAWILLVLASMTLIGYGIVHAGIWLWMPTPAAQEASSVGSRYIFAGWLLAIGASVWSHLRGNPVWATICVALPGFLVGWADLVSPYTLASVVSFPLALAGVAEVIWARGHRQRG